MDIETEICQLPRQEALSKVIGLLDRSRMDDLAQD